MTLDSKEVQELALEAIEVAKATGKIRKGTNETTKAVEKGDARLAVIAKDVSPPEITMHIPVLCEDKGALCVQVSTKEELGAAAGLEVGTSAVAVTKEGDAVKIIKQIKAASGTPTKAETQVEPEEPKEKDSAKDTEPEEPKEEAGEEVDGPKEEETSDEEKPAEKSKQEKNND